MYHGGAENIVSAEVLDQIDKVIPMQKEYDQALNRKNVLEKKVKD